MQTHNPVLRGDVFRREAATGAIAAQTMTIHGTVNKTILMAGIAIASALYVWHTATAGLSLPYTPEAQAQIMAAAQPFMLVGLIGYIGAVLVTAFKPAIARFTWVAIAPLMGLLVGGASAMMESFYPQIVLQAAGLTFTTLFAMLVLYKTGMIVVTQKLRSGIMMATGGIMVFYLLSIGLSFVGVRIPLVHEGGVVGIGVSLFIVGIASLNLLLDFDFIEKGERSKAPRHMEWYGAMSLLVTLVWLYMEFLRLLAKMRD